MTSTHYIWLLQYLLRFPPYGGTIPASEAEASNSPPRATGPALALSPSLPNRQEGSVSPPQTDQGAQVHPRGPLPQAGQYLLRQKPAGLDGQGRPRGFVYVHSSCYLGIYTTGKSMFRAQLPKYAWMPSALVGVRSHKIKWLSYQRKVDIKALPDQPYANQP